MLNFSMTIAVSRNDSRHFGPRRIFFGERTGDQTERCVGYGLLVRQNCLLLQNGEQSSGGGRRLWHGGKAQVAPVAEMK